MIATFRDNSLPRLRHLTLFTSGHAGPFTIEELETCGGKGGWDEFENLQLQPIQFFPAFFGRIPHLALLNIGASDDDNIEALEAYSEHGSVAALLGGQLRELHFQGPSLLNSFQTVRRVVPRNLLKLAPQLEGLSMFQRLHAPFDWPQQLLEEEISDVANLCPNLVQFDVNVQAINTPSWSNNPLWPIDVLKALAQCNGPLALG
jgi:hypothetical protein